MICRDQHRPVWNPLAASLDMKEDAGNPAE
jgi:hypothetical protein